MTQVVNLEKDDEERTALLEKTETKAEVPGTSVTEIVQDIIVEGSQTVVKDVLLKINQAIELVEKGVLEIQETFHQKTVDTKDATKLRRWRQWNLQGKKA
ncbi:hypothetical protein SAY86_023292 [Trapa natans]|uniref:Uncharacterized protein n=1 Tax=Trapa natans TaxID=22666 RepID=A0AAN7R7Q6_TRANT|nr:hypothetical protein SAY86_023292 [Trapa natans]